MIDSPIALIFDMDDTLVATAALWREAESALLEQIGHTWSRELAIQYKGMNALDVAGTIHRLLRPTLPIETCQAMLRAALCDSFEHAGLKPMPGAQECVRRAAKHFPLAVASGSPLPLIHLAMSRLDLANEFRVIVSSESVTRGKPAPDIFLAAATSLNIPPGKCVVVEDSLIGVQAAKAAGMPCFAVPSSSHFEIESIADRTFACLGDINPDDVRAVFKDK